MKKSKIENELHNRKIIVNKYPNYSYCRGTKQLFRSSFGMDREIKREPSGLFKVKKEGVAIFLSDYDFIRLTNYSVNQVDRVMKSRKLHAL